MKTICLVALSFLIFLSACDRQTDCCVPPPVDLLPLQVGNSWTLKPKLTQSGATDNFQVTYRVDKRQTLSGRDYMRMVRRSGTPENFSEQILFYRVSDSNVYVRPEDQNEEILYRMRADIGDHWNYGGGQITLTAIEDYTFVNADTTVSECRSFSFDIPSMFDEEYAVVLAPRLGFVSHVTMGSQLELSEAVIDGKKHTFF